MSDLEKPTEKPRWATGGSAAVTTPPSGKQDLGWVIEYPPHQFFNWLAKRTYEWINYFEAKGDTDFGGAAQTALTISAGSVTPTLANHRIDTEAAAASDDLANILPTNLNDGRMLLIRSVDAGRVVTLKHLAGGSGELNLRLGADVVLNDPNKWVLLTRNGTQWVEVLSSFLGGDPAPHLGADLDTRTKKITTTETDGDVTVEPNGTGALAPATNGKALGKTSARWAAFLSSLDLAGNLTPDTDGTRDLGATGTRWDEVFGDYASFTNWIRTSSLDCEDTDGTLNIGDVKALLINIGRAGATIALHGSVTEVHVTNTFVQDPLPRFNDGGLANSAANSGFELEEDGAVTGWVKTSDGSSPEGEFGGPDSRVTWRLKAPYRAGETVLRPLPIGMSDGLQTKDTAYVGTMLLPTGETHTHLHLDIPSGTLYYVAGRLVTKDLDCDHLGQLDNIGKIDDIGPREKLPSVGGGAVPYGPHDAIELTRTSSDPGSTTLGTYTDVPFGTTLDLTPGVWEIEASIVVSLEGATGSGVSGVFAQAAIRDSANNLIRGSRSGFANAEQTTTISQVYIKVRETIAIPKSYKLSFTGGVNSGTPSITSCSTIASSGIPTFLRAVKQ